MTWFVLGDEKDYSHAFREIKRQRDRGAGLIAVSILQDHLLEAIKSRLERNSEIENKLFNLDRPLGSFSTQIDVGYLLGLYSELVHRQLHIIRRIRNDFAHNVHPVSFKSQRSNCSKLNPPKNAAPKFRKTFSELTSSKARLDSFHRSNNPRTQFLRAAQRITMYLALNATVATMPGEWKKDHRKAPKPYEPFP